MLSEDEFDDLIADNNFQLGRDYEQKRIIALLKEDAEEWYALGNKHTGNAIKLAIWLIKGENE